MPDTLLNILIVALQMGGFVLLLNLMIGSLAALYRFIVGQDRITHVSSIKAGADWDEVKVFKSGIGLWSRFNVRVTFKDGTKYVTELGNAEYGRTWSRRRVVKISYDDVDLREAVHKATVAHEAAVRGEAEPALRMLCRDILEAIFNAALSGAAVGFIVLVLVGGLTFVMAFMNSYRVS